MIERLRQLLWKTRGEERLFSTHRAPFQETEHAVGETLPWRGRLYRVTRWEEVAPVTLERGGTTKTWDVWGHPLSEREVQAELDRATAAILAEATEATRADPGHAGATGGSGDEDKPASEAPPPDDSPFSPA